MTVGLTNGDEPSSKVPVELWRHADPTSTPMWKFLQHVNSRYNLELADYPQLYKWSVENVPLFWEECWHFVGIKTSKPFDYVSALRSLSLPSAELASPLCEVGCSLVGR